ncbi:hypothetical protein [Bacillus sp. ISL-45]|uniref:hypothetical protein n=1 Tax=Bacillus sp. ISL-45 TaxID=2819128 RepID=UPI001BEAC719|nr:hypothetical protein [Bacillus sp. ISL-45]MBT2661687.1 hypothetical protein [Bacillus sp. ISL-45]
MTLISSLLLLYGCSNDPENNQQNFDIVASEKNLPANMHELAFQREETPRYQYLVRMSDNQADFENFWSLYGFKKQAPEIDFKTKSVFFIGVYESGSCPSEIENVESNADNTTITIAHPDGNCTADATPRTFVIQIDKEEAKNLESVIIVEGGTETSVPLKN